VKTTRRPFLFQPLDRPAAAALENSVSSLTTAIVFSPRLLAMSTTPSR
jgi:hypothetical protein